jgi:hypothetical protein
MEICSLSIKDLFLFQLSFFPDAGLLDAYVLHKRPEITDGGAIILSKCFFFVLIAVNITIVV